MVTVAPPAADDRPFLCNAIPRLKPDPLRDLPDATFRSVLPPEHIIFPVVHSPHPCYRLSVVLGLVGSPPEFLNASGDLFRRCGRFQAELTALDNFGRQSTHLKDDLAISQTGAGSHFPWENQV